MGRATKRFPACLSIVLLALALHACVSSSGGANPGDTDMPAVAEPGPTGAASAQETVSAGEGVPAAARRPTAAEDGFARRIAPDDLLKIEVAQASELSREGRVSKEGTISMPLIGEVQVGGLTPKEAERRIVEILRKDYLQDPKVSVFVAE